MRPLQALAVALLVPGCFDLRGGDSLAELDSPSVSILSTPDGFSVQIRTAGSGEDGCPRIADDVEATLDGSPLHATARGTWHKVTVSFNGGTSWCSYPSFTLDHAIATSPGSTTELAVSDSDTTWTIDVADLGTFALATRTSFQAGQTIDLTWPGAGGLQTELNAFYARTLPDNDVNQAVWQWWPGQTADRGSATVTSDSIKIPVPPGTYDGLVAQASRWAEVSTCDGPSLCEANVAQAQLTITR